MIEEYQIVDSKSGIEPEPDYDNRSKRHGDLCGAEWLNQKEENKNCACGSDNSRFGDIRFDNVEALHSTKNRLGWTKVDVSNLGFGTLGNNRASKCPRWGAAIKGDEFF